MSNDPTTVQTVFAALARQHPNLSDVDHKLMRTFERMMLGALCDERFTITGLCLEAGVSRATYYRSPVAKAVTEILTTPPHRTT